MFRKGRRDDMLKIAGYRLDGELQPAANGYVGSGTRVSDGKRVFLKQFDRYVAPSERALASGTPSALERQREFEAYREHLARLDARLLAACGSNPNPCLVRPVEVVRCGSKLVHVTELVDTGRAVPPSDVHRRYPRTTVLAMFEDVLRTVDAVHRQGIVLIDIKDANTFVLDEGRGPRCLLFDYDDAAFAGRLPDAAKVVGTPEYFSPELAAYVSRAEGGDSLGRAGSPLARAIDRRHDIFALGLLLHLLLTGKLPNGGDPAWKAVARGGDRALALSGELGSDDRALITWMLRRNPADRPTSCGQILERLDPRCTVVPRFGPSVVRRRRTAGVGGGMPAAGGPSTRRPAGERRPADERRPVGVGEGLRSEGASASTGSAPTPKSMALAAGGVAFDPPREDVFAGVAPLAGDRVRIYCADGSVLTTRVAELTLYGLGDQVEPMRRKAVERFGKGW